MNKQRKKGHKVFEFEHLNSIKEERVHVRVLDMKSGYWSG